MNRWWLDELAHAGAEHLDPAYVAGYERKAGFDPTEDLDVLRGLGLGPETTLVDLGAGTGAFAVAAARVFRRVVAVDVSPAMVAALRDRVTGLRLDNVTVVQAGWLSYSHRGEPPDAVYTRNTLHHLPDFWKVIAFHRIAAMLKPRGIFHFRDLILSVEPDEVHETVDRWLAGAAKAPEVGWTREELETHLREEYSTFSWLIEPMLERAGFEIRARHGAETRIYLAYTCVRV